MISNRTAGATDRHEAINRSATDWLKPGWEATVTDGLILLGFLAILFAILVVRGRRRLGVGATGKTFAAAIAGFAIAVLILWATQR